MDKARDLRAADQVKRRKGSKESDNDFEVIESYTAHHHPDHKWYYLANQKFNEGWLIKLYDSQVGAADGKCNIKLSSQVPSSKSTGVLHTSFDIGQSSTARRSCEVRMLVKI